MKSTTTLREATARFPVQEEQVEGGEDDSDHAGARGGPIRRRWPEAVRARVSSWAEFEQRKKKVGLGFVQGFIRLQGEPRHTVDEGGVDSERGEEEHGVLLASMREEKMRMNSSFYFDEEVSGLALGHVLGCVLGQC
jgi:hypothetical protein